jgi:hypothetical protein
MIDPNQARHGRGRDMRPVLIEILVLVALALAPALPSWAGEQGDAAAESAAEAPAASAPEVVPCSELARVKYPFLTCVRGPSGRPVFATEGPGLAGARLEFRGSFASGGGAWGSSGVE